MHVAATAHPVSRASPTASAQAGSTGPLGGVSVHVDLSRLVLFGAAGAAAGMFLPIPGGAVGGAAIGAALAILL